MSVETDGQITASEFSVDLQRSVAVCAVDAQQYQLPMDALLLRQTPTKPTDAELVDSNYHNLPLILRLTPTHFTNAQPDREEFVSSVQTRIGVQHPMYTIGTAYASGSGVVTYVKKRARDSGSPTPYYVTWTTSIISQPYPFTPPFGGPLVDTVIAEIWQV